MAICPELPGEPVPKSKTNLDFTEARDSEWQRHQLDHMQICTSPKTDNHASTSPLSFYRLDVLPAAQPTASKHWRQRNHVLNTGAHCAPPDKHDWTIWAHRQCTMSWPLFYIWFPGNLFQPQLTVIVLVVQFRVERTQFVVVLHNLMRRCHRLTGAETRSSCRQLSNCADDIFTTEHPVSR